MTMTTLKQQTDDLRRQKVSVHGGHSGQFCNHAKDSLQEVIEAYIAQGFSWVGITEHLPPLSDAERYPDEVEDGLSAAFLQQRFVDYFRHARELQQQYADRIELLIALETETYPGYAAYVQDSIARLRPDYIVGSVHHACGLPIDVNASLYREAVAVAGSVEALYCAYFDAQYGMLQKLQPAVVGHFDLIRIFDPDYLKTLARPAVQKCMQRNLEYIAAQDFIMDFNLRGFDKSTEQYPCMPVLQQALAAGITVVPGDDSHGVSSVGRNYGRGLAILEELGVTGPWRKPKQIVY